MPWPAETVHTVFKQKKARRSRVEGESIDYFGMR
jgi:hypothetical protein